MFLDTELSERKLKLRLLQGGKSHTSDRMEADQVMDHGETDEIDLIYDTTSQTISAKKVVAFYFVKHHHCEDLEIKHKIEKVILEIQEKKEEIDCYYKDLKWYRV